jgi:hypothetical protein
MTILNRFTNNSVKTLVDAATIVLDAEDAPHYQVTITANRTLGNPSNPAFAKEMWIAISQDGVGNHTLAFASDWVAIDPVVTLNPAPNTISVLHATSRNFGSGVKWYYSIDSNTTTTSVTLGGDVTGSSSANKVTKIQNVAVPVPTAGVLTSNGSTLSWATAGTGGLTASVNNMAALASFPGVSAGNVVEVLGFYTPGDAGGGTFYWNAGGAATPVVGMIVNATGGQWVRLYDKKYVSVKWFGARGDGASHLLSSQFGTYAQAVAAYPNATKRAAGIVRFPANAGGYILEGMPLDSAAPAKRFYSTAKTLESSGFIDVPVRYWAADSSYAFPAGTTLTAGVTAQGNGLRSGTTSDIGTVQPGGITLESDAAVLARYEVDECAIQAAILYIQSFSTSNAVREVFIPSGVYFIRNMLTLGTSSFGPDSNCLSLKGAGGTAGYSYGTALCWVNPTEIDAILNVKGFESIIEGIEFVTGAGCTTFAGILLKNGTPADRDLNYYGMFTSRISIRDCAFGNYVDNLGTTKSQRGVAFDSHFRTDGNIEEMVISRCAFSNCMLSIDVAGGQPYSFIVRECMFMIRGNAAGAPYGISFYSAARGGTVPYDMDVYGCEFQRQWVNKHLNSRHSRWYGNSLENCKAFWWSGYFNGEPTNSHHEFRGMRWNLSSTHAAFDLWEPDAADPRTFIKTAAYPELTQPTEKPPYWCWFGMPDTIHIAACCMEAQFYEINGDYRNQGIIARNPQVSIVSTGNNYANKRPFVVDDYGSWGQSPFMTDQNAKGVTSLNDTVNVDNNNRNRELLAPMHNTNNPSGTVVISGTATKAVVNYMGTDYNEFPARGAPEQVLVPDHDRGAIWNMSIIQQPPQVIVQPGFLEFNSTPFNVDTHVRAYTGTPPPGAFQTYVTYVGRSGFDINVAVAPGAGNSVTVVYRHWK